MRKSVAYAVMAAVLVQCSEAASSAQGRVGMKIGAEGFLERRAAYKQIMADREQVVHDMLQILREYSAPFVDEDPRLLAVQILGAFRSVEAVPWMLKNIDFYPPQDETALRPLYEMYPCVSALIKIGKPASMAVLKQLEKDTNLQRVKLLCLTMEKIEGKKVCVFMLGEAIGSTQEKETRQRLTKALRTIDETDQATAP